MPVVDNGALPEILMRAGVAGAWIVIIPARAAHAWGTLYTVT